jgi:hypothetical protein
MPDFPDQTPVAGPGKIKTLIAKLKGKIGAINALNEKSPAILDWGGESALVQSAKEKLKNFKTTQKDKLLKKISDLKDKRQKKITSKTDIFGEMLDLVKTFLVKKETTTFTIKKTYGPKFIPQQFVSKDRLHFLAHEAVNTTIMSSKNIVMNNVKSILFAGDGICGSSTPITGGTLNISPGEFDFMNILTVNPTSNSGQIVYEPLFPSRNLIKMNRTLYSGFTSPQSVESADGKKLFDLEWIEGNQSFNVTNIGDVLNLSNTEATITVGKFFDDYYSNIEQLDLSGVTKTAMMMVLKGDGSEPPLFDIGMNDLNRLLNKLMSVCNNPSQGLNQNVANQFNEDDVDIESYFDFDDMEGIDLDDESNRFKKVLKFTDCNDFTIPSNPSHYEDFVYLSKNDLNNSVNDVLLNVATTTYQEAGGTIPLFNLHASLLNTYILNLPKALIGSVLSPKYILPIVIIYRYLNSSVGTAILTAKEIMKKLNKLFFKIIKDILWKFLSEFWRLVKKDLLDWLKITAWNILTEKYKKYRDYILSIVNLIRGILNTNLNNCNALFTVIDKTIDAALYGGPNFQVPGIIDSYSYKKPGFSNLRTIIGIVEQLEKEGVNASQQIFGQDNNLLKFLKTTFSQQTKEINNNSYVHVANQLAVLPVVGGVVTIPPGAIVSYGGQS